MVRNFAKQGHVLHEVTGTIPISRWSPRAQALGKTHSEDHLGPTLLAAITSFVRFVVLVPRTTWTRIFGSENDFHVFKLEQPLVDVFLQVGERAQNDLIDFLWQLQIHSWIVLRSGASHHNISSTLALSERCICPPSEPEVGQK